MGWPLCGRSIVRQVIESRVSIFRFQELNHD
jgi:hypothetical protein